MAGLRGVHTLAASSSLARARNAALDDEVINLSTDICLHVGLRRAMRELGKRAWEGRAEQRARS
jgi:hypothetical protein